MNDLYESETLLPHLRELRARLHRIPEMALQERETPRCLTAVMNDLPVEQLSMKPDTGCAFLLRGRTDKPLVVLRSDMDALPITEQTGLPYASRNEGMMHACGHDFHMTALVGAARLLCERRDTLPGSVLFLFQPAEEILTGARLVLDSGLFDRCPADGLLAMHVWPGLAPGQIGLRDGVLMSAKDSFTVSLLGKSAHGSSAAVLGNAIMAGAALEMRFPSLLEESLKEGDTVTATVCSFHAGKMDNVIPEQCVLLGNLRTFSSAAHAALVRRLELLCHSTAAEYGCTARITVTPQVPPLVSDPRLTAAMAVSARELFGEAACPPTEPVIISEDFSVYGDSAPISCALFGVGGDHSLHHPLFYPDDRLLPSAARFLAGAAIQALERL